MNQRGFPVDGRALAEEGPLRLDASQEHTDVRMPPTRVEGLGGGDAEAVRTGENE